jgi:transposase
VLARVGVEGTSSYGAGLTRHLRQAGVTVVEIDRPDRRTRRARGKSDPIDAYAAARTTLAGVRTTVPKSTDGVVEAVRVLRVTRRGAVKARTQTTNQLKSLLVTAPAQVREPLQNLKTPAVVKACARLEPGNGARRPDPRHAGSAAAPGPPSPTPHRRDPRRGPRAAPVDHSRRPRDADPPRRRLRGDRAAADHSWGQPDRMRSEAAFAHLCGVAPIPASSGRTHRHRLNRGGDRAANNAIYTVVLTRLRLDERTRNYYKRRRAEGLSKREVIRCLQRYVARELYQLLVTLPASSSSWPTPRVLELGQP